MLAIWIADTERSFAQQTASRSTADRASSIAAGKLIREYRTARNNPNRKNEIVNAILELEAPGVLLFEKHLRGELTASISRYRSKLSQAARKVSAQKLRQINANELQALRSQFSELLQAEVLSKQQIETAGDQIVERLEAMFLTSVETVLKSNESLQADRQHQGQNKTDSKQLHIFELDYSNAQETRS